MPKVPQINHSQYRDNNEIKYFPEPFLSMKGAAAKLNIQYWKIQRAVKDGIIPYRTLLNKKKLIKISDILAVLDAALIQGE